MKDRPAVGIALLGVSQPPTVAEPNHVSCYSFGARTLLVMPHCQRSHRVSLSLCLAAETTPADRRGIDGDPVVVLPGRQRDDWAGSQGGCERVAASGHLLGHPFQDHAPANFFGCIPLVHLERDPRRRRFVQLGAGSGPEDDDGVVGRVIDWKDFGVLSEPKGNTAEVSRGQELAALLLREDLKAAVRLGLVARHVLPSPLTPKVRFVGWRTQGRWSRSTRAGDPVPVGPGGGIDPSAYRFH